MTRDEAIKVCSLHGPGGPSKLACENWVDLFSRLGMLTLDEPKSRMTAFCEEMHWPEGGASYQILFNSLEKAGLKIVEK